MFSSIRFRLTFWYVVIFGLGVTIFTLYLFSALRTTIYRQFDDSLLHAAQAAAGYFTEFTERDNAVRGATETVKDMRLGKAAIAILRGAEVLAVTPDATYEGLPPLAPGETFGTDVKGRRRFATLPISIGGVSYRVVAI